MARVVLVTGAAGFIGSHLCESLLRRDDTRVVGIDSFEPSYGKALKVRNLEAVEALGSDSFQFEQLDLRTVPVKDMAEALAAWGVTSILHFAASAGVRPSVSCPVDFMTNNVTVTTRLLEAVVVAKAKYPGFGLSGGFVLASSSSVYGNVGDTNGDCRMKESQNTDTPVSPYSASKKACELVAHAFFVNHGLPVTCLRLFSAYGPRQRPDLAVAKFMALILAGAPLTVYGDGSMTRDYTYVADIVDGVLRASDRLGRVGGYSVYNLGCGAPVSIVDLVGELRRVTGRSVAVEHAPVPKGDVKSTHACIDKAAAQLGYAPKTRLVEGLERQWAWLLETTTNLT